MAVNRSDPKQAPPALTQAQADSCASDEALATQDVALVSGRSEDGDGLTILRSRQGRLEAGVVRPLTQGKPIQGEVIRLKPRKACPVLCDVEMVMKSPVSQNESSQPVTSARSGPPQVASDAYRTNWDAIYRRGKNQQLLN